MTTVVSVLVTFHNAERYVDPVAEALRGLDREAFEIIAVDDRSTDGTRAKLDEWVDKSEQVRQFASDSRGIAAARNLAASHARGRYVWFIDCDDTWDLEVLHEMVALAESSGADAVVANATMHSPDGVGALIADAPTAEQIDGHEAIRRVLRGDIQGHVWNKLFARHLFDSARFPPTQAHSDLGGILHLFGLSRNVQLLPRSVYRYHVHEGSLSTRRKYRWEDLTDCLAIAEEWVMRLGATRAQRRDLAQFALEKVLLPIQNETVRRERWEGSETIASVRRENQRAIKLHAIAVLLARGRATEAGRALAIKAAPRAYSAIYRLHRRRHWAKLDRNIESIFLGAP